MTAVVGTAALIAVGLVVAGGVLTPASAKSSHVFVSHASGSDSAHCGSAASPCRTVTKGLARAARGATVSVLPGTYHEQVVISSPVHLVGDRATIDATGLSQGSGQSMNAAAVLVLHPGSGSSIRFFRITGAYGEGVLVLSANRVRIAHNRVDHNDVGTPTTTQYMECQAQGEVPGDCGEGIHLMSARNSVIRRNRVAHNSGGVLVTDEFGPASGNRIVRNRVVRNLYDCGITMPGHNPGALAADGTRQPSVAGVYGNLVKYNRIIGNGVRGEGAGVLIAAAMPGAAAYGNRIVHNVIRRNNLAGVTMHAHAPNQDINGNVIRRNTIGRNNLGGDPDAGVTATVGILIYSALPFVTVHVWLRHNHIRGNVYRVWKSANVTIN